ncbi:MAG: hypothetical protein V4564_04800 [Pseudomonadota bacterium]|uniref:hypothetical protein n=1 Tax=Sphingomonas sp. ERG5 TaxID=1381597 RepID=UPI00054C3C34|nr:hypothetical protein [Sphingomonas sp. ERG5]
MAGLIAAAPTYGQSASGLGETKPTAQAQAGIAQASALFPDPDVKSFMDCVQTTQDRDLRTCKLDRAKINYEGYRGITPLLRLVTLDLLSPQGITTFIKQGADPFIYSARDGLSAAKFLVTYEPVEYLEALYNAGVDINYNKLEGDGSFSIIAEVISDWDQRKVDFVFDHGGDIEQRSFDGSTPLLQIGGYYYKFSPFIKHKYLLDRGASPFATDYFGDGICNDVVNSQQDPDAATRKSKKVLLAMLKARGIDCSKTKRDKEDTSMVMTYSNSEAEKPGAAQAGALTTPPPE